MSQIPQRQIALSFTLAQNSQTGQQNTFAESGTNTLNILGLRTSVQIRDAYTSVATAIVKVWGLTQSLMNQFSSLGINYNDLPKNQITIQAGDNLSGMSTIFTGTVFAAYGEYENQPDVPFTLIAQALAFPSTQSSTPTSFPQSFSVATALTQIAQKMGMTLQNFGVSVQLPPMYVSGSPAVQARKIADAAQIDMGVDNLTLDISPKNQGRSDAPVIVNRQTGMIAYPGFAGSGLLVKTIFNPNIKFKSTIIVQSSVLSAITQIKNAQGANVPSTWLVNKVDLDLDALVPKGQWMTTVLAYNPLKANAVATPAST